jgi:hypothetical protein
MPLESLTKSDDFFPEVKLLKSIDIDSAGGKTGGDPLSFLQLLRQPANKISIRNRKSNLLIITIFFTNNEEINLIVYT